jgi:hypothetical protein
MPAADSDAKTGAWSNANYKTLAQKAKHWALKLTRDGE